ncbi:MAG: hypothetical protein WAK60_00180 [Sedimentisphaerales bacterium]
MKLQRSKIHPNTFAVVEDDDENLIDNSLEHTDPTQQEYDVELEPLVSPPLFDGQGDATPASNDENGPLVVPVMNFDKPKTNEANEQITVGNTEDETPLKIPTMDFGKKKN